MKILLNFSSAISKFFTIFLITLSFIIGNSANAYWDYVGSPSFINGWSFQKSLAFLGETPYIAVNGSVMKFDGTDWVYVGLPNFVNGFNSSLTFSDSTPHVAFVDSDHNGKISVMKYNGNNWVYVGNPGFSEKGGWRDPVLVISDGVQYVAFIEGDDYDHRKVSVMKFDGTNWNYVGNINSHNYPHSHFIAVNSGTPYVAFSSNNNGAIRTTVQKFDGVSWVDVGQPSLGAGTTESNCLVFCETPPYENVPYIVFNEGWIYTRIMRFNGQLWVNMGPQLGDFTWEQSMDISIITPYVAYVSFAGLSVWKLEGHNWVELGTNIAGGGGSMFPSLKVNNGVPYVAFNAAGSVSVMKFRDYPLPVELSSFVSTVSHRTVQLKWTTSSETNNSGFYIERNSGNGNWTNAGFVAGHGTVTYPVNYSFTDRNLNAGIYNYRLKQIDINGNFQYFNLNNEVSIGIPSRFEVYQNYPNPFNPSTKISFDLPVDSKVNVTVFDLSGKEIVTLINDVKTAGYYTIDFNASNLSSGIYFYRISAGNFTATKKMTIIK